MATDVATVTRQEAARLLGAGDRTLRRLIARGTIRVVRGIGQDQLLVRDDVMRLARTPAATIGQAEAAALLGVSARTVRRRLRTGEIDGVATPGGVTRVLAASIDAALEPDITTLLDSVGHGTLDTSGQAGVGHEADKLDTSGHRESMSGHVQDNEDAEYVPLLAAFAAAPADDAPIERGASRRPRRIAWWVAACVALAAGGSLYALRPGEHAKPRVSNPAPVFPAASSMNKPAAPTPTVTPASTSGPAHAKPTTVRSTKPAVKHPKKRPPANVKRPTSSGTPPAPTIPPPARAATGSVCNDLYGSEGIC